MMATNTAVLCRLPSIEAFQICATSRSSLHMSAFLSLHPWPAVRSNSGCSRTKVTRRIGNSDSRNHFVCSGDRLSIDKTKVQTDSEVMVQAREAFCDEVNLRKHDDTISLAKGALLISAEDQAFIFLNREMDSLAKQNETSNIPISSASAKVTRHTDAHALVLGSLNVAGWMEKFEALLVEVEAQLGDNEGRRRPLQILQAVNSVLFKKLGFNRTHSTCDPSASYMDHVLTLSSGSGVMLGIIYMELCQRMGLKLEGAALRESFLVWPIPEGCAQMVIEPCNGGQNWMLEESELCPSRISSSSQGRHLSSSSAGSTLDLEVVRTLERASNRDILGIVLKTLKKAYWKRSAKARPGLTPAAPLQAFTLGHSSLVSITHLPVGALLRPEDLRLAVMASERLLLLEPQNWALRKEHGLLLYHSRRYGEAVQELSICMALAPMREEELLQPFVERLHLMRLESTWGSASSPNTPSALV